MTRDELGQDYERYVEHCQLKGLSAMSFYAWLVSRLNSLEDQLLALLMLMHRREGDTK